MCRQGWWTPPKANISAIFKVPMEPFFQLHFFIDYFTLPCPVVCFHFSSLFKYKKTFNIILFFFIKCKYTAVIFRKSAAAYRYHRIITIQVITRIRLFQSLKILFLLLPPVHDRRSSLHASHFRSHIQEMLYLPFVSSSLFHRCTS